MSLEDDTENGDVELRELVTQTLEENGVLSKIKAQLRAGLYLALENDINTGNQEYNNLLKTKLKSPDIRIIFSLVREFLEYFELNYTCSIFEKESLMGTSYTYENREKLIQELDIGIDTLHNSPLLLEILNIARSSFNLSVPDIQNDIKFSSTTNPVNLNLNVTYDIISEEKLNQSTESNSSEISQHVIEVKTVPKDVTDAGNNSQQKSAQYSSSEQNKSESIPEEILTEQSEVIITKNGMKLNETENDDTYEGTSSIAEDSVVSNKDQQAPLIDFDKSVKITSGSSPVLSVTTRNILDQSIEENQKSPRLSSGSEQNLSTSSEKRKLDKSDRLEKLKPMSALSSLSDLPPLQLNKTRSSDTVLLPSLYSKREKAGMKDFDKLFDLSLDNYEEDFLSSTSLGNEDANLNIFIPTTQTSNNKLIKIDNKTSDDRPISNKSEKISNLVSSKDSKISEEHSLSKEIIRNKNSENGNHIVDENTSNMKKPEQGSNTSSISEEFDINSNVDDILKSESTT